DGTSAATAMATAFASTPVRIRPNTDSPILSDRAGRGMLARTGTARASESTAAPTAVTTPSPSASPAAPSPAVTVTTAPTCTRAAYAGVPLNTTDRDAGSADY